jgi:hypothetical protein
MEKKPHSELTPEDWRVRLGRDYKIKEIVMAKVIQFYVPEELPETVEVGCSATVRKGHRVLLADPPSASPAVRLGLSPIAIPSALTEKSVHLQGR